MIEANPRFGGIARLFGAGALASLQQAHVCVVGIGGVGSWTVEALARSGVGRLTLVDLDDVCVTNINRQLHALDGTVGQPKAEVMAARVRQINPDAIVQPVLRFLDATTAAELLAPDYDCVVDAIDNAPNKCRLIAGARAAGRRVVSSGGAGGRSDPTRIRTADLAATSHDRLLAQVRTTLRQEHGFPRDGTPFHVPCVFSTEAPMVPHGGGEVAAACAPGATRPRGGLGCDAGWGTASYVTGTFGFMLASLAVQEILANRRP